MTFPTRIVGIAVALAAALLAISNLTGCGTADGSSDGPLRVVASSTPHAEILKEIQDRKLLGEVKIEVTEITGDLDPNALLVDGDVDANFFQHDPYLKTWQAERGTDTLVNIASVHIEPLGLYSSKIKDVTALPEGATVALSNNVPNFVRGLFLLQDAGLITLNVKASDPNLNFTQVGESNITNNPKKLKFIQIAPQQLANTLNDGQIQLSVINGNYALEAGLSPAKDALKLEAAVNNPYANTLTVPKDKTADPRAVALAQALTSPEIATWIAERYQGAVIPVAKGATR